MKSHADEIWEEAARNNGLTEYLAEMRRYAKGLEFALECIGKGMKLSSDFSCAFCDSKKPHIHTAGDEAKLAVTEERFSHRFGTHNPCGKPFCSVCYPTDNPAPKSDGPC
jgi:hypothetical protein